MENAFSFLIPPGERFFVLSASRYLEQAGDDEARDLIQAFVQQEELHSAAHEQLNASLATFGVDVERESRYADAVFARLSRILPPAVQLGVTAFAEHLTAVAAHLMFVEPAFDEWLDPQMLEFWRWHAAEELEHKAVAFNLFHRVAGGYWLRVTSAATAAVLLALPYARLVRHLRAADPHRPTRAERRQTNVIHRKLLGPQVKLVLAYFSPRFHPWRGDDGSALRRWYGIGAT